MYQFESRVRFSETDGERKLKLEAMVDYFQDCSTFQTEDLGVGFSYLLPQNLTWVLSYWHIVVEEYPKLGDKIKVCTLPYGFKGCFGKRNFFMETEDGRRIVKADSLWTFLNTEKKFPAKIPTQVLQAYPQEEKINMEYLPRKITAEGEKEEREAFRVQKIHLDCNGHVNNGQYIKMAAAYLPEKFKISQMRAEYKKQAFLGDEVYPYIYVQEQRKIICLCDKDSQPYVIVEFQ